MPEGGWTDAYKGDNLVLRLVAPGTFLMGSPPTELGRSPKETRREVTLCHAFYIGVFEVTQQQWWHVMGRTCPAHLRGDSRPVEGVTYPMIRGEAQGARWPADNAVDDGSFMEVLRTKTGMLWDLPTEAQWEYACRAGTTTALNSGKDLTARGACPHMAEVGRYAHNQSATVGGYKQHTTVGSYRRERGGCMTCTGMCGSGAWIGGPPRWARRQELIRPALNKARAGSSGAAAGATARTAAGQHSAAIAAPMASTRPSGCGLSSGPPPLMHVSRSRYSAPGGVSGHTVPQDSARQSLLLHQTS